MGISDPTNKPWTAEKIAELSPSTILDCGAGAGIYLSLIREKLGKEAHVTALEIWRPYIDEFNIESRYDALVEEDLRNVDNFNYDLVILGDIVEHLTEADAIKVWDKISKQAKYAIISIPIVHYHQGAENGNPYEIHLEEDWSTSRVLEKFSHIVEYKEFRFTGVFIAKFDKE